MTDLLFYKYNILAGVLVGLGLSIIAPPLLSRRQAPFIFSFSQISINILLFSIIFNLNENKFITALIGAIFCYLLQSLATKVPTEKENLVHTSIFVGLYSINQLLIAKFPQLQSFSALHNTGDLVTILNHEALALSFIVALLILGFLIFRKQILLINFKTSSGIKVPEQKILHKYSNFILLFAYYFILSLSNLYFGFLYTVGSFFILSLFASFVSQKNNYYYALVVIILCCAMPGVFYYSIQLDIITVPLLMLIYFSIFFTLKFYYYLIRENN